MKNSKTALLAALVFLVICSLAVTAQKTTKIPLPRDQNPTVTRLKCPDIKVSSFKASLVSTQWRDPLVEFPHDKVRLEVVLENAGTLPVTSLFITDIIIYKNGERISGVGIPAALGVPGSRFVYDTLTDSFPHGVKTVYSVEVLPLHNECATANNRASLAIDEARLHKSPPPFPQHR